ncbi:MAG: hypothetical protein GF364_01965 [Candidatus Lokiarchaeota archaeon]|nr:hypothetical protein [Candidatus Lokiarchaeota archaeon]
MTLDNVAEEDMICPKCGCKMYHRKIWHKLRHRDIKQCEVCRYYEEITDKKA